jgi:hypothetical protein
MICQMTHLVTFEKYLQHVTLILLAAAVFEHLEELKQSGLEHGDESVEENLRNQTEIIKSASFFIFC